MLKKLLVPVALVALVGCQPPAGGSSKELVERIEKLEKKVEALEKRPAGAAAPAREAPPPQTAAYKIPTGTSPFMGNKDGKIELTIFSDYQCPFCSRVDPMLHEAAKDPELKDKIKITFKQFPLSFHKDAKPAAKAALASRDLGGNDAFWKMNEKLYANQRTLTAENFSVWAKEIGLDVKKFDKALVDNDAKYEEEIKNDSELGAKEAKVRGTPSLFVNGWELKQRSVDGVKQLIKEKSLGG
jgi:protein-disulfide isomerase